MVDSYVSLVWLGSAPGLITCSGCTSGLLRKSMLGIGTAAPKDFSLAAVIGVSLAGSSVTLPGVHPTYELVAQGLVGVVEQVEEVGPQHLPLPGEEGRVGTGPGRHLHEGLRHSCRRVGQGDRGLARHAELPQHVPISFDQETYDDAKLATHTGARQTVSVSCVGSVMVASSIEADPREVSCQPACVGPIVLIRQSWLVEQFGYLFQGFMSLCRSLFYGPRIGVQS